MYPMNFIIFFFFLFLLSGCTTKEIENNNIPSVLWDSQTTINSTKVTTNEISSRSKVVKINQTYSVPRHSDETAMYQIEIDGDVLKSVYVSAVGVVDHESLRYIDSFNQEIGSEIKGKSLKEVKNISTVGWASITTDAFKNALKEI